MLESIQMPRSQVRVRIAPSPTGFAHVGTAYTALFNYAYAKSSGGKFIVRLEDTDVKRHVKTAEDSIYDGLTWLGISWDEGLRKGGDYAPYRQSERLDIYKKKANELIASKMAYEDEGAIRFKNPGTDISWRDLVRGDVSFPGGEVGDFVILKSDGYPTYNFAVVIDDILMKISHVIRGEEHISNTPKQLAIYNALGEKHPKFVHHPTLRNKNHKKLSKRKDSVDLAIYKKQGYLPDALVNFLTLLGWSHPKGEEIFTIEDFVNNFDLKRVRKAGPIFNIEKLDWINGEYIRKIKPSVFSDKIYDFYEAKFDKKKVSEITPLIQDRIKKLSDFESFAGFFFKKPKVDKSVFGKDYRKHLKVAVVVLGNLEKWDKAKLDKSLLKAVDENNFKTGDFFMSLRVAITGSRFTPPINESLMILGKNETVSRLNKVI